MTYPIYGTGTVNALATGATLVNFSGAPQLLSNAAEADKLSIAGYGEVTILGVNADAQLAIRPWPFGAVPAGAAYAIIQDGASRSTRNAIATAVTKLTNALNTNGFYVFVPATLTAPDPSLGDEGQFARQPSTRKEWQKLAGVWTFTGTFDKSTVGVDGTAAAPAFSFAADTDTGIYRIGPNNIGIACAATKIVDISTAGVGVIGALAVTSNITASGNATVSGNANAFGPGGAAAIGNALYLEGTSGSGGGSSLHFRKNGADHWFVGDGSNIFGNTNDDLHIYSAAAGNSVFNIAYATGAATFAYALSVGGNFAVNTNKFNVTASNGNTAIAGTLAVVSDLAINANKFNVTASNGNTAIAGALAAAGDFAINTNKFTVAASSGNTVIAGSLAGKSLSLSYALTGNGLGTVNSTDITGTFNVDWSVTQAAVGANSWYFLAYRSAAGADNEFLFRGDGTGLCDGAWIGGGADYAEYFEWADGNPDNEDRRGLCVVLAGAKIRLASPDDAAGAIIGVVSARPTVVGDAAPMRWKDKYERDEYGLEIMEDAPFLSWTETRPSDVEGEQPEIIQRRYFQDSVPEGVSVPDIVVTSTQKRRKLNPQFDPAAPYIPRDARPEWSAIGLMGKLVVRKGQPLGERWIKLRDVSAAAEQWLVR